MAIATAIPSTVTPAAAPVIPPAPRHLSPRQARAVVHSGELAIARGLRLLARGHLTTEGHEGEPMFMVSSASRPGLGHLVWIRRGRIWCDCEARKEQKAFTCSHAQFVRLLLLAELTDARTAPEPLAALATTPEPAPAPVEPAPVEPAPVEPAPARATKKARAPKKSAPVAPAPEDDPDPTPPPSSDGGPRQACPTCGLPSDPAEIADLGECLSCCQMRADYAGADVTEAERRIAHAAATEGATPALLCWACGALATAETVSGLYCDDCVSLPPAAIRAAVSERAKKISADARERQARADAEEREATARRVIARQQDRERAGAKSAASPRAGRPAATRTRTPRRSQPARQPVTPDAE